MSPRKASRNVKSVVGTKSKNLTFINVDLNSYLDADGNAIVIFNDDPSPTDNPIGVLTERNRNVCEKRRTDTRGLRSRDVRTEVVKMYEETTNINAGETKSAAKQKIPRPPNAFMLFANEWRKKLASENPKESNKDISVRLGMLWKSMSKDVKEKYFTLARQVDAEHKRKYPGMV